jgi:pyroglutamyl-peptidase
MKILITAFEPFGNRIKNSSLAVLDQLSNEIGELNVIKEILPVEHKKAPAELISLLESHQPDAVICLGEAGGTDYVRLEFVALNWMDFRISDNSGVVKTDEKINPNGKSAYFSTLPLRNFEVTLTEKEIPVEISMTAGTFLCNQIFYVLMQYLDVNEIEIPAGFIHLPAGIVGDVDCDSECTLGLCVEGVNLILVELIN